MMETTEPDRRELGAVPLLDSLSFPSGLPGFKDHQLFHLTHPPGLSPLVYLQSLETPYPRFILVPAERIDENYQFDMEPWDRDVLFPPSLGSTPFLRPIAEITLYFIVAVAENSLPTVNKLAPIAIRESLRRGVQAVRADSLYSHAETFQLLRDEVH